MGENKYSVIFSGQFHFTQLPTVMTQSINDNYSMFEACHNFSIYITPFLKWFNDCCWPYGQRKNLFFFQKSDNLVVVYFVRILLNKTILILILVLIINNFCPLFLLTILFIIVLFKENKPFLFNLFRCQNILLIYIF